MVFYRYVWSCMFLNGLYGSRLSGEVLSSTGWLFIAMHSSVGSYFTCIVFLSLKGPIRANMVIYGQVLVGFSLV